MVNILSAIGLVFCLIAVMGGMYGLGFIHGSQEKDREELINCIKGRKLG